MVQPLRSLRARITAPLWKLSAWVLRRTLPQLQSNAFTGAGSSRLTADWIMRGAQSADQELRGDLKKLRSRARDLGKNNPHAVRFLDLVSDNVIGPHGIRLQARVTDSDGRQDENTNRAIERAWKEWCQPEHASADGKSSWLDIQRLLTQGEAGDGEAIVRMLPGFDNPFGFTLQVLDPDQLDEQFNRPAGDGTNEIRMGVEINRWGRPLAYHVFTSHPGDFQGGRRRERIRIPAAQIIHHYEQRRPGQTRGWTRFAPIMLDLKMLAGYQEAELVAARTAAAKMGFFVEEASDVPDPDAPAGSGTDFTLEAEPGLLETLPAGISDFKPWDPDHPTTAYESFTKALLRAIATGLKTSYASLTGDLADVNFSSIRAGVLQERDVWRRLQLQMVPHVHRRVYLEWFKWAFTMGRLALSLDNRERWLQHEWRPRGWSWVDPLKELKAAREAIELRLDSRTRLAAEQGRDYEEVLDDLEREEELAARRGLIPAPASTPGAAANRIAALMRPTPNGSNNGSH